MRSTLYGPEEFILKSKKPRILALVAGLDNMTVEAIEKLDEKSDIRRGLLMIKRKREESNISDLAERLADQMTLQHHPEFLDNQS